MTTITGSYQFAVKDGSLTPFKTVGTSEFFSDFGYGDIITGNVYPVTARITSEYFFQGQARPRIKALKNTLNYYRYLSDYYTFQSGSGGDRSDQELKVIHIPSIFYGQSIKKGSVSLKWFVTGALMAELTDTKRNGELVHSSPYGSLGSGNIGGVVLYNEGVILLHGHYELHDTYRDEFNAFDPGAFDYPPKWTYFMTTGSWNEGEAEIVSLVPSSSYGISFEGTEQIPIITMLTHAQKGEFNHSNNPTFVEYGQSMTPFTSSNAYIERDELELKNIVKVSYNEVEPKFEKTTFISKVGIYDENKNLIAVAKLATPVRKKESDSLTIKLKLDM